MDDRQKLSNPRIFQGHAWKQVFFNATVLAVGAGAKFKSGHTLLVDFIAINDAAFAVV